MHYKIWGIQKCRQRLGVTLVTDNCFHIASDKLTYVYNLKGTGPLLMDIHVLHFEDLGDTECRLAANAICIYNVWIRKFILWKTAVIV